MDYLKHEDLTAHSIEDWAVLSDLSTVNCEPLPIEIVNEFADVMNLQTIIGSNPDELNQLKKSLVSSSTMPALVIMRMDYMNYFDFDPLAAYLIASISRSPGEAVMYIWISTYILKKLNLNYLTVRVVCEHLCPFGRPKQDYMQQMWDLQKVEYNGNIVNMLDHMKYGESLNLKLK